MSDGLHIPAYSDLLWPTLCAVREIGNSGTNEEIVEKVIANEGFTEEQLAVPAGLVADACFARASTMVRYMYIHMTHQLACTVLLLWSDP